MVHNYQAVYFFVLNSVTDITKIQPPILHVQVGSAIPVNPHVRQIIIVQKQQQ